MSDADPAAVVEWPVWSSMARLCTASVAVNFAWEMAQMRLYASTGSWLQDSVGCLTASLGDGGMILMIWATGAVVFRRLDWFRRPRVSGYAVRLTMGVILAVALEMSALRSGRWAYGPSMPRMPVTPG